ncbi:transglutaminase-like cysteine peptidase [Thiocystis violacea]|uniref:transglutaminase-like cysteine peptidase n=1 Tax=Thiocystis violacea TaxID=13725 RepID=UPI001908B23B|nr:hypothetical protein [Thiocystis violacea]
MGSATSSTASWLQKGAIVPKTRDSRCSGDSAASRAWRPAGVVAFTFCDLHSPGVEDYWETPGEFFAKAGDCEDYAIVKFMSLRALGFGNDDLLLVAVKDQNLDIGHAITLVSFAGRALVLDNQVKDVIPAERVRHYQPVFSANEVSWWLYRPR